jgi:catechol 2,3-dioxygenase-like lactoylglutathione lyase family enzyme
MTERVRGVLETCLYATDLDAAERFYSDVLGLDAFSRVPGRHVFFRCGDAVFLVFNPDRTAAPDPSGGVPPHGARGPGHVAFSVTEADLAPWRERLAAHGVEIEAEVTWPSGGRSLYVRDPAGNSVELAPASIWGR